MANRNEDVGVRVELKNKRRFLADAKQVADQGVGKIGAAADKTEKRMRKTERSAKRLHGSFNLLGRGARLAIGGVGATAGLYGVSSAFKLMYDEAVEARKATADTRAVIKSTGGAANLSADQIAALAAKQSRLNAIDDEAIQLGQNKLLTFTKIGGKGGIFERTSQAAIDLSARFDKDLNSSFVMVGKAVNDPIKGLTALGRVGVQFTKQQKEQIEALVESGDTMGAQRKILKTLEEQVKGSARAQATPMEKLQVTWNNLAETAGTALLPHLETGAEKAAKFISQMANGTGEGGKFVDMVKELGQAIGPPAKDLAELAVAAAKFTGEHPELLKMVGVLIAVGGAVKLIRFAGAVTGVNSLLRGLRHLPGAARTGSRVLRKLMGRGGTIAGKTAAVNTASGFTMHLGGEMDKRGGRNKATMRGLGKGLGLATGYGMAVYAAAEFSMWVGQKLEPHYRALRKQLADLLPGGGTALDVGTSVLGGPTGISIVGHGRKKTVRDLVNENRRTPAGGRAGAGRVAGPSVRKPRAKGPAPRAAIRPRVAAGAAGDGRPVEEVHHHYLQVDGRTVAESTTRINRADNNRK